MNYFPESESFSKPGDATEPDSLIAPPPIPSKKFQEEAFGYVSRWCKAAHDFVQWIMPLAPQMLLSK